MRNEVYKCRVYLWINYWLLKKPTTKIGEECNCTRETIRYWLIKYYKKLRTNSEASKGRIRTKQHTEKIRKSNIGKKRSIEARKNISNAKKGNKNPMYGKRAWNKGLKGKSISDSFKKGHIP